MKEQLVFQMCDQYEDYLMDESRFCGAAESISFPENEQQILKILAKMKKGDVPITIQGGKTGIVGAAVPLKGHIMNLSRMNQWQGWQKDDNNDVLVTVQPGINLLELKKEIKKIWPREPYFWPPQPTETSATVGGIAATGAKGINQHYYGPTSQYIHAVRLIDDEGQVHVISRNDQPKLLELVLGKEGITGVFSEITIRLIKGPVEIWGISFFFETIADAAAFATNILDNSIYSATADITAAEYFDRHTIDLIEQRKPYVTKLKEIPDVGDQFCEMIYLELEGDQTGIEELADQLMELAVNCHSDPDQAWAVSGETEVEKMRDYRHGAAEAVNFFIEQTRNQVRMQQPDAKEAITKLGTDMQLEGADFYEAIQQYRRDLEQSQLKYCIFGHLKGAHLHVNILPDNLVQYQEGRKVISRWAKIIADQSGEVVNEHGIGKIKKELYSNYGSKEFLAQCKSGKERFNKRNIWNQDNIL